MCAPLWAAGGRPAATLAISVAVSRASQIPPLIPTPAKCGMRNAECGIDRACLEPETRPRGSNLALPFRIPHSAFRIRLSPNLLEFPDVRLIPVAQSEVAVEGW